ncbi:hypothetical protein D9M70_467160 [compost metagenome]
MQVEGQPFRQLRVVLAQQLGRADVQLVRAARRRMQAVIGRVVAGWGIEAAQVLVVTFAQILWAQGQPARVMVKVQTVFREQVAAQRFELEAGLVEGQPFPTVQVLLKPFVQLRQALQNERGALFSVRLMQGVQVEHLGLQHQRIGRTEQVRQGHLQRELVLLPQQAGRHPAQLLEALTAESKVEIVDGAGDLRAVRARQRRGFAPTAQRWDRRLNPLEFLQQSLGGLELAQAEAQVANAPRQIQDQFAGVVQRHAVERPADFTAYGGKALLQEGGQDQPEGQAIGVVAVQVMREMEHGVQPRRSWKFARNFQTRFEPHDQLSLKNQGLNELIGGAGDV